MAGLVNALIQRTAATRPKTTSLTRATGDNTGGGSLGRATSGGASWGSETTSPNATLWDRAGQLFSNPNNLFPVNWGNNVDEFTTGSRTPEREQATPTPYRPYLQTANNASQLAPMLAQYGNDLALNRAQINNQAVTLLNTQKARQDAFAAQERAYRNQLGANLAEANLDIQGFDIQQGNFPQWYKFLAEQWGNRMNMGKADLDFVAEQQVNSANQRLIDWNEIQQGRKVVDQQAARGRRDATSSATVSGVIQNAQQDYNDIEQDRTNAQRDLDFVDEKSRLSETQRRQELSNRRKQLIGELNAFDINTRESQAKLREREQLLDIEAKKARLKPQQLMDQLNVTMANLGLDKAMSTGQFLEAFAGLSAQDQALVSSYGQQTSQYIANNFGEYQRAVPRIPLLGQNFGGPAPANPRRQTYDRQGFR